MTEVKSLGVSGTKFVKMNSNLRKMEKLKIVFMIIFNKSLNQQRVMTIPAVNIFQYISTLT